MRADIFYSIHLPEVWGNAGAQAYWNTLPRIFSPLRFCVSVLHTSVQSTSPPPQIEALTFGQSDIWKNSPPSDPLHLIPPSNYFSYSSVKRVKRQWYHSVCFFPDLGLLRTLRISPNGFCRAEKGLILLFLWVCFKVYWIIILSLFGSLLLNFFLFLKTF